MQLKFVADARLYTSIFASALLLSVESAAFAGGAPPSGPAAVSLFDGTLDQWEGNPKLWRVQDGTITGGSLTETITENEFLCTKREYTSFVLRLKFKLTGTS